MSSSLKSKSKELLIKVYALSKSLGDPGVPWTVKVLVGLIVAYIISPIDIISDFIPVLGLLDEAILVPIGITLALKLMPDEVMQKYENNEAGEFPDILMSTGIVLVLSFWLAVTILILSFL